MIYSLGFLTCMVGKGFLLIFQGRLEPSENFAMKPYNPIKLLGILGHLKGVTKLSIEAKFSCVYVVGPCFMIVYPLPCINFSSPYHVLHQEPPTLTYQEALVAW
jgi:hypothetical protein